MKYQKKNFRIANSQDFLTIAWGGTWNPEHPDWSIEDGYRFQFYWPYFKITNRKNLQTSYHSFYKEIHAKANTLFRAVWAHKPIYRCIGFRILGFGLGFEYCEVKKNQT